MDGKDQRTFEDGLLVGQKLMEMFRSFGKQVFSSRASLMVDDALLFRLVVGWLDSVSAMEAGQVSEGASQLRGKIIAAGSCGKEWRWWE